MMMSTFSLVQLFSVIGDLNVENDIKRIANETLDHFKTLHVLVCIPTKFILSCNNAISVCHLMVVVKLTNH